MVGSAHSWADDRFRHQPRMGAAAWIAAVAAALVTWLVALALAIGATADSVHTGAVVTLCLELFGFSDHTRMAGPIGLLTSSWLQR